MAKPLKDMKQVIFEETQKTVVEEVTFERIKLAYRRLFNGEDGSIVLADMKARFHNGSTVKRRANGIDPLEMAFNEGQRAMYVGICEQMQPPVVLANVEQEQETL